MELESRQQPFFLWIHFLDAHHPYLRHPQKNFGRSFSDRYDGEIFYTDSAVGAFLKVLYTSPLWDSTVLIVHSDHGEGFMEHGYKYHGQSLYEDQIRVPLIIKIPRHEPKIINTPVMMLDIFPTLTELFDLELPDSVKLEGRSLAPLFEGELWPDRPVFSEMVKDKRHSSRKVIIHNKWKLQYSITYGYYTLFDLDKDPGEQKNLVKSEPKTFKRLKSKLQLFMNTLDPSTPY